MSESQKLSRRDFLKIMGGVAELAGATALPQPFIDQLISITPETINPARGARYIEKGDPKSNKIAITIDDGWYPEKVEAMLKVLEQAKAQTSFFPVGTLFRKNPELWKHASIQHELLNHTHAHLTNLNTADKKEIERALVGWEEDYAQLGIGEFNNKALRPPALVGVNNPTLYEVATAHKYKGVVGWTIPSSGSLGATPQQIIEEMTSNPKMKPGAILLFHFVDADIAALPAIINHIRGQGLEPCKLSDLPGTPLFTNKA